MTNHVIHFSNSTSHDFRLTFEDLTYKVHLSKKETKTILHGLSSTIYSDQLTAIMGASGSGKTSLLNSISGQAYDHNISIEGKLLLNGNPINKREQRDWAFVFQDDVILQTMTVREALYMSARLRLPKETTEQERQNRIASLLDSMNLLKCEHTMVGDSLNRGISGGERKRLSIAMELIRNPYVIMLDEPTSGLDTYTAYSVISQLKHFSKQDDNYKRIIVSTIHQPSSDIFHLFDRLILLHDGKMMYDGNVSEVIEYFSSLGFQCPTYSNPADYLFMFVLNKEPINEEEQQNPSLIDTRLETIQHNFEEKIQKNEKKHPRLEEFEITTSAITKSKKYEHRFTTNFWTQFVFLFRRAFQNYIRNKLIVQIKFMQAIIIGLFVGLTYFDVPNRNGTAQVQDRVGVMFFMVLNNIFSSAFGVLSIFNIEKTVFVREYRGRYYGLPGYFLSKTVVEMPFNILFPFLTSIIIYFMVGLQMTATNFFIFGTIMVLCSTIGLSLGIAFASIFANLQIALALTPLVLLPLMLVGGLYVNLASIPQYIRWLQWISPMRYGFQAAMINEFSDLKLPPPMLSGNVVLQEFAVTNDGLGLQGNMGILVAFWFGLWLLAYFALMRVTYQYKKSITPKAT